MKSLVIFIVLFICALVNKIYSQFEWEIQTLPSNDMMLGKVQFVSKTEGWIAALEDKLLHTTNAGLTWNLISPFPNDTLFSFADPAVNLCFVDSTTGWIIRSLGTTIGNFKGAVIHKTTDGGLTWNKIQIPNWDFGFSIQFIDKNIGWATVATKILLNGALLKTTDGGLTWNTVYPIQSKLCIPYFIDSNEGWMAAISLSFTGTGFKPPFEILHTVDGGRTWTVQYSDNNPVDFSLAIHFTDKNNGWVVGSNGRVLHTKNGGSNWTQVDLSSIFAKENFGTILYFYSKSVFFLNELTGWIGVTLITDTEQYFLILSTNDGGNTWQVERPPINGSIISIYFVDANTGWIVTDNGQIARRKKLNTFVEEEIIPSDYYLSQNFPNPFNPVTKIQYKIPNIKNSDQQHVTLKVYDMMGREVATLINESKFPGVYEVVFNASNLSSGVYLYKIIAGEYSDVKKMVLLK